MKWLIICLVLVILLCSRKEMFKPGLDKNPDNYVRPTVIPDLLSEAECDHIIHLSEKSMGEARVGGHRSINKRVRNNHVTWLYQSNKDSVVQKIYHLASKITGYPVKNFEAIQVIRYGPEQFYKPHYDQCHDPDTDKSCHKMTKSNPRVSNIFIYLSDDYEGGETIFPKLNIAYRPQKRGDGIHFHMLNKNKEMVHDLSEHGGSPVKHGLKYACNVWVRERPYN